MIAKNLVIVESPAKAKTISRVLGNDYYVTASMGHVRDLPEGSLSVDVKNNFAPVYEVQRKDVVKKLREASKDVEHIYLASDPDREGEAIAWHVMETLKKNTKADFKRVVFHEITPSAVSRAFKTPRTLNMNLVDAQQARRVLDRLVGYKVSEFLWSRVEKGISAGRVQSVALRIICDREREILNFKAQEYWNLFIDLEADPKGSAMIFRAKLATVNGEKAFVPNTEEAQKIASALENAQNLRISRIESKDKKKYAPPPFITSTMQQVASTYLRFSPSHTMRVAQDLYEGIELGSGPVGLITYMRTDSVTVSSEALGECRKYISQYIGPEYLPESANRYKNRQSAQEAHEAIRPTDVFRTPDSLKADLSAEQLKLYTLIWKRFIASQMKPAELKISTVETSVNGSDGKEYGFRTSRTETIFNGYMKLYNVEGVKEENSSEEPEEGGINIIDKLSEGMILYLLNLEKEQKFTEPPARFSEASLIRELESNGIGRPSTYASIVNTILKRGYVEKQKGKFVPGELGFKVRDFLVLSMPDLFDISFTAKMETELDEIEEGKIQWTQMLEDFYSKFSKWLNDVKNAGAPENEKVKEILSCFDSVTDWGETQQRGRRRFNDKHFLESIRKQFSETGKISAKQWKALLLVASRQSNQIPHLDEIAKKAGFLDELSEAKVFTEESAKRFAEADEAARSIPPELSAEHLELIAKLQESGLEDAPPNSSRRRFFNESKFVKSLKKQIESGKVLTEKQINALKNIEKRQIEKNRPSAAEDKESEQVSGTETGRNQLQPQKDSPNNEKIKAYLKGLSAVTNWAEPVKKEKRTFDDKAFYESLLKQFETKGYLSRKQVYALAKIARKYAKA